MSQSALEDDALAAPAGRPPYRTAPGSARRAEQDRARSTGTAPARDAALPLPGDDPAPAADAATERPAPAPRTPQQEAADAPAASPAAEPARPRTAASPERPAAGEGGRALVVIENGVVKYADPDVYVADLGALVPDGADPDALFQTLKDLRGVRASDARALLVDRVHGGLRNSLDL